LFNSLNLKLGYPVIDIRSPNELISYLVMKTKEIKKDFDSVEFFRKIKEQIAKEFEGKTFEQKKEIINKMKKDKKKSHASNNYHRILKKS